jgi:hypothetical protein
MKINKDYLITSGCSFTEGHKIQPISWATKLSEKLKSELINLGKGGRSNDSIIPNTILYAMKYPDIAKNSFFVIQLTECLRYNVSLDLDLDSKGVPMVFTPNQFMFDVYGDRKFDNWDMKDRINKWVFDNRYALAPIFVNITERLYNTHKHIINFINFCEGKGYPFLIFDGINQHIPIKIDGKWYLEGSNPNHEKFEVMVNENEPGAADTHFYSKYDSTSGILKSEIDYLKNHKYYYNDEVLYRKINNQLSGVGDKYTKGNDGHPNEEGSEMWSKHLIEVINGLE